MSPLWLRSPLRITCTSSLSTLNWVKEETPGPMWCCVNKTSTLLSFIISKYLSKQANNKPDFTLHSCSKINKTLLRTRAPYSFPYFFVLLISTPTHILPNHQWHLVQ